MAELVEREIDEIAANVADFVSVARDASAKSYHSADPDPEPIEEAPETPEPATPSGPDLEAAGFSPIPRKRPPGVLPWTKGNKTANLAPELDDDDEDSPADPDDDLDDDEEAS